MKRIHSSSVALVLVVTTSAWAGGGLYPPEASHDGTAAKTRAEVIAELQEAERQESMLGANPIASVAGKSRAEVRAETDEAARLGLLSFGEGDPPTATAAQQALIAAAGERALTAAPAAAPVAAAPRASAVDTRSETR